MDENTMNAIGTMTEAVAAAHDAQEAAYQAAQEAEARLLDALLAKVRPALRALASRHVRKSETFWPDTTCPATREWRFDWAGLLVCGDGPVDDYPRANGGKVQGCDLFLLADGTFKEVTYTGRWTRWQGAGSGYEGAERDMTAAEVVKEYSVPDITDAVATALRAQLDGRRAKATARLHERAEKIEAVVRLLK